MHKLSFFGSEDKALYVLPKPGIVPEILYVKHLIHTSSGLGAELGLTEKEHLTSFALSKAGRTAVIIHRLSNAPPILTLLPDGG